MAPSWPRAAVFAVIGALLSPATAGAGAVLPPAPEKDTVAEKPTEPPKPPKSPKSAMPGRFQIFGEIIDRPSEDVVLLYGRAIPVNRDVTVFGTNVQEAFSWSAT